MSQKELIRMSLGTSSESTANTTPVVRQTPGQFSEEANLDNSSQEGQLQLYTTARQLVPCIWHKKYKTPTFPHLETAILFRQCHGHSLSAQPSVKLCFPSFLSLVNSFTL